MDMGIPQTACFYNHEGAISERPCTGTDCPLLLCPKLRDQILALLNKIALQDVENIRLQSHLDTLNGGKYERRRGIAQGTL